MLLITAVSIVFTSGALQGKVHYQYGADEQFVMSEDQNFVILLLDTVDSRTITELLDEHPEYSSWVLDEGKVGAGELPVKAKREGEVPGIHTVTYKSNVDEIQIYHSAYSRDGFAQGAVMAAEFLMGKKGVFGMEDLIKIKDKN